MVRPEEVDFRVEAVTGTDAEGNDVTSTSVVVAYALVAPGDVSDVGGIDHPQGDVADLTLYCRSADLPGSLRGATAIVPRHRGREFAVIGDPLPYPKGWATREYDTVVRCKEVVG